MNTIIVYPDNSVCINGTFRHADEEMLQQFGVAERRPAWGSACDSTTKKIIGEAKVKVFGQPAHADLIRNSANKHEADRRRNERTTQQHAAMVRDYNALRTQGDEHDMACMKVATKWGKSAVWIHRVVKRANENE